MEDEILYHLPEYTIARSHHAETLVPYAPADHVNGDQNHGWFDLRGHPELVASIPEAQKSEGLSRLLKVIAAAESKVMSSACDCAAFQDETAPIEQRWHVGGYVEVMLKDGEKNADPKNLINLAGHIVTQIEPSSSYRYEMIIEPLKHFFGRRDCFGLMLKPIGFGPDEAIAWASFNLATNQVASVIENSHFKNQ